MNKNKKISIVIILSVILIIGIVLCLMNLPTNKKGSADSVQSEASEQDSVLDTEEKGESPISNSEKTETAVSDTKVEDTYSDNSTNNSNSSSSDSDDMENDTKYEIPEGSTGSAIGGENDTPPVELDTWD